MANEEIIDAIARTEEFQGSLEQTMGALEAMVASGGLTPSQKVTAGVMKRHLDNVGHGASIVHKGLRHRLDNLDHKE